MNHFPTEANIKQVQPRTKQNKYMAYKIRTSNELPRYCGMQVILWYCKVEFALAGSFSLKTLYAGLADPVVTGGTPS